VGIFSERDYARKIILLGKTSMKTALKEIMTENVGTVSQKTTIDQAMALMTELRIRHLPVVDENELIGIISIGDLVLSIVADQAFMIDQLEKYITGTRA
jgi:CBS domain-containing protein